MRSNSLCFVLWCCIISALAAQNPQVNNSVLPPVSDAPATPLVEQTYVALLQEQGSNARYQAAEQALQHCETPKAEFCAKLYNLLAEEAYLKNSYELSKYYYQKTLTTDFEADYYKEGLLAARMRLNALVGLRNIAINEAQYDTALVWHSQYVDSLQEYMGAEAKRYQQDIDHVYAVCYQKLGASEKAINYLMPHAFGSPSGAFELTLNKAMVDALAALLQTKYPKKAYKKELQHVATAIHSEEREGVLCFYIKIFENKIYFRNDSANYPQRVARDPQLHGQAIAHYQRKLLNSYFYQSLLRQY